MTTMDEQYPRAGLEQQAAYWQQALAGELPVLGLWCDHPRLPVSSFVRASASVELDRHLYDHIKNLCTRETITLYVFFLAAFKTLLLRYTEQEDIIVGSLCADSLQPSADGKLQNCVNPLALRTSLADDPSFLGLLKRVARTVEEAAAHRDYPFEKVLDAVQILQPAKPTALFQVMFVLCGTPPCTVSDAPITGEHVDEMAEYANQCDVVCIVSASSETLTITCQYDAELFTPDTIGRQLGHYRILLQGVVANPDEPISKLLLLTEAERRQLLVDWNDTRVEYPRDQAVHQLFEVQVARSPDALAVVHEDRRLTYGELNARANRLAHHLRTLGVGPEVLVGLCLERSLGLVVGVLGILKAGGAYVPLDPGYPRERLAFMLEDTQAPVLLTQQSLCPKLPPYRGHRLRLDTDWPTIARESQANLPELATSQNLAYVIYTSGSTGTPKGVEVCHRSVARLLFGTGYVHFGPEQTFLLLSPIAFDASTFELWGALLHGGRCVIYPERVPTLSGLETVLRTHQVTMLWLTASLFNAVIDEKPAMLASVAQVLTGGEALSLSHVRRALKALAQTRLINGYGPTENTTFTCCHPITPSSLEQRSTVPIGRPIANTEVYVLDRERNPVPVGAPGELYIGGDGLARGYWNRLELTAEKFIPNPFNNRAARLYKTGDLARYLPDGTIEFLGRLDHQVKIRGFRIELGEIEVVLGRHSGVRTAVVAVYEPNPGDKRLAAYVVQEPGTSLRDEVLRPYLKAQLPDYMIPTAFVFLEALPLTPNGKVDRKALPVPNTEQSLDQAYVAPGTPVEERLAAIWAELLQVERVGRHDNFFALGGHSLLAVVLTSRMRRAGLNADVRVLFTAPTVAELAAAVGGAGAVDVPPNRIPPGCAAITPEMLPLVSLGQADIDCIVAAVPGGAANVQDIYPLAPLQEGILFHHLMGTEGDAYLLSSLVTFDTRERLDGFLAALQAVVARHDILRTAVAWEGLPEPVQVVWREAPLPVEEVELDAAAGDAAGQLAACFDPQQYRIDLRAAPLLRAFIARNEAKGRWLLLLLVHHLAIDHTTLEILLEEIQAHRMGRADRLPAPLPFRSFVAQARRGVTVEEHEAFFRQQLGDVDEPTAPFGLLDAQGDGSGIQEARLKLNEGLARRVRERARALGVGVASLCHLAWAQVLARVSGREDVVFGTVLFGRMQGGAGADRALGLFINTLPVRIRVGGDSVLDGVRQVHALLAGLLRHEHAPLVLAQRCSAVPAPAPLFTALLNYRHSPADAASGWEGIELLGGEGRTNYPVTLSVDDLGEGFSLTAQTLSPVEPERVCGFMHTALGNLVEALEAAPDTPLWAVEVLPAAERRRVLYDWNATEAPYPRNQCIHELFEAQAVRTPEAVAAVWDGGQMSYAELNARANQLAHYLRGLGIKPDTRVAICVGRGPDMIVGLLGILKAGGAYVPLDPGYPRERLAFMLEDTKAPVLVTRQTLRSQLPPYTGRLLCLDADSLSISQAGPNSPRPLATPRNLAYVIYTSGSTGKPKGVMIEHRSAMALITWAQTQFSQEELSGVLASTSLCFDLAVFELFVPLSVGGRVVLAENALQLPSLAHATEVTLINTVPSAMRELLRIGGIPPSARTINLAGEPLAAALVDQIHAETSVQRVYDLYGPTEDTTYTTFALRRPGDPETIGRPIANTRVYLLDRRLQPVPVGVSGELCIGGAGLARGYLHRPGLTAEKFIPDPFSDDPQSRLYKTGDLGCYRADGNIVLSGRIDHQVKIRGFRIEPGEIEVVLGRHSRVRTAVAAVYEPNPGDKRLAIYVVPEPGGPLADETLRAYLKTQLPEHMVPAAFVFLEALPLTPNGKVDRKALPIPDHGRPELQAAFATPRTPLEQRLAAIWAEVLGIERVGIDDNFFDLGGHSLLAVQVIARVQAAFQIQLPLRALFEAPTVARLAQSMGGATADSFGNRPSSIPALPRDAYRDQASESPVARPKETR